MANPEDIARAQRGRELWNAWAGDNPGAQVDFSGVELVGFDFSGFLFPGGADFEGVTFKDYANFKGATFKDFAKFRGTRFQGPAVFWGAMFEGRTGFEHSVFKDLADFRGATFQGPAVFLKATFDNIAEFSNADFNSYTSFINCHFATVPEFHGATLHEDTTFEGVIWPEHPHEEQSAYDAARAWGRLRVEMSRLHRYEDELFFFERELGERARDTNNEPLAKRLLYRSYVALGTGRSVVRPLGWLLGLNAVLFFPIYWVAASAIQWRERPIGDVLADVVSFTLAQALPLIGGSNPERVDLYRRLFARADSGSIDVPLWLEFVGAFQQLVAVGLLFMIGLALRNRFRMK